MGFFSAIGSAFSSACSWVGSAISTAASWAGSALSAVVRVGGEMLSGVGSMAMSLLKSIGLFRDDDPPIDDWGDRAMQAEAQSIFPDQFDNFTDYLDTLRNFELDPQMSKESTLEQKSFKGLEVAGRALEYKYDAPEGSMANVFVLGAANPHYFTSERFQSLLGSGMDINDIADYFQGKLGGAESLKVEDALVELEQSHHPGKDEAASREELYQAQTDTQEKLHNILH